jgi:AraC-like DNA-binding protein
MNQFFNVSLLIAGIFQAVVLSLLILRKNKIEVRTIFLIGFIFVLTLQMLLNGLDKLWVEDTLPWFIYNTSHAIPLLLSPLAFLYVKYTLIPEQKVMKSDWLLFIPFAYCFLNTILYQVTQLNFIAAIYPSVYLEFVLQLLLQGYCIMIAIQLFHDAGTSGQNVSSLKDFFVVSSVVICTIIIALKLLYLLFPDYNDISYLFLSLPLFMYWFSFKIVVEQTTNQARVIPLPIEEKKGKYSHTNLTEEYVREVEQKILHSAAKEKVYLESGLSLESFAAKLSIPKHHASQVLNDRLQKSFADFINEYRIEAAAEMLIDPAYDRLTIAGIAFECGFNSVTTFNIVFKKIKHTSPSAYKKQQMEIRRTA